MWQDCVDRFVADSFVPSSKRRKQDLCHPGELALLRMQDPSLWIEAAAGHSSLMHGPSIGVLERICVPFQSAPSSLANILSRTLLRIRRDLLLLSLDLTTGQLLWQIVVWCGLGSHGPHDKRRRPVHRELKIPSLPMRNLAVCLIEWRVCAHFEILVNCQYIFYICLSWHELHAGIEPIVIFLKAVAGSKTDVLDAEFMKRVLPGL